MKATKICASFMRIWVGKTKKSGSLIGSLPCRSPFDLCWYVDLWDGYNFCLSIYHHDLFRERGVTFMVDLIQTLLQINQITYIMYFGHFCLDLVLFSGLYLFFLLLLYFVCFRSSLLSSLSTNVSSFPLFCSHKLDLHAFHSND